MDYKGIKDVTILGIGGKGAYYISRYLLMLGVKVYGYDLKSSDRTKDLECLGANIKYSNPNVGERFNTQAYIYSNDLPQKLQEEIHNANIGLPAWEVGELYHYMLEDYEKDVLNAKQLHAFVESDIAPLYEIDLGKMKYIAVTGTDGKTTTCTMIYHILKECGFKPALVTTVSAKIGDMDIDTGFHTTTPTSQEIFSLIKRAEDEGCTHIVLETTSHGLLQGRVMGLKFDSVGYTNITEEHLDYHKSWDNLFSAKSLLINKHLKNTGTVILNLDDIRSYEKLSLLHSHITYSSLKKADIYAQNIIEDDEGISFNVVNNTNSCNVYLPLLGRYNISNFLAALGIVISLEDVSLDMVSSAIKSFKNIKGRMEVLKKDPYYVIVDYAHTPNAILSALESVRRLTHGRVIHVFGTAGHRDFYKRPVMGKLSNELADITILTAEDPRLESLKDINDQIEDGWRQGSNKEGILIRFDDDKNNVKVREDAIKKALELAINGDVVIITGKAHEESLCFSQTEYPWNDITFTKSLL